MLDREEKVMSKRTKTWSVILFTNLILVFLLYFFFDIVKIEKEKLIVLVIGIVSIISINLIVAVILHSTSDSREWKKWFTASLISFFVSLIPCFY